MKTKSFLLATLISTLLQSLYYIVITGITLLLLPRMMEMMAQDLPSSGGPPPGFFNFMGISMLTTGVGFLLAPLVHAGTGVLYAWLHRREEPPVTAEQGALGGAAAAFTARFVVGILMALGSLLVSSFMLQALGDVIPSGGQPFASPMPSIFSGVSSVVGGLFGTCFGSVIAAALGALGGSITGALLK